MIVTSRSSSYSATTDRFANRSTEMFVLDENQQKERGDSGQSNTSASADTSFSAKLAGLFLVPERPDVETGEASLGEDTYSQYEKEFMELADKPLAERIRDQYLKEHDLTEDHVDAMAPEDREALETEIRDAILEAMGVNEEQQDIAIILDIPVDAAIIAGSAEDKTTQP